MTTTTTTSSSQARAAGRGGIAVLGAKAFFIVTGFIQQPLLKLALGRTDFGGLAQAMLVANVVNNVVISSGTQGVSRAVAGAPGHEREALRAALRVHAPIAIVIALSVVAAAPLYAWFERANDVILPLVVLAGVAFLYGLYAPLIGYLNGTKTFTRQAALDVTFAGMRTVGLVGVGYLFVRRGASGVLGTTAGWLGAAVVIVLLAVRWTGIGRPVARGAARPSDVPTTRAYLAMLAPIAIAQLATNLLMQTDLFLLGRMLADGAERAGLAGDAARDAVKDWLAIYKECQTFAFLPYQLLFSITLVLFPMLARAKAENDHVAVRAYVARGTRLGAIACGMLVVVVVAVPESLLSFAYGAVDAARGAPVLRVLGLGQGMFAMLGLATTVLTSLGRERRAAIITACAVAVVGVACWFGASGGEFGADQLLRTATATASALTITAIIAGISVRVHTGAFVPPMTAVRVLIAVAACVAGGWFAPRFGKLLMPIVAAAIAIAYLIVLAITGEVGRDDAATIRSVIRRK